VPSASRHTRTLPSPPPLTMTGVPSGSTDRHRIHHADVTGQRLPDRGAIRQPPDAHPAVATAATFHVPRARSPGVGSWA
jgi:hypothetical protein